MAGDYERQEFAVGVCTHGYCGGVAAPDADSTAQLYISHDGGVTWTDAGPLARGAFVWAVTPDGVIASTYSEPAYSFALLPGGKALTAPSAKSHPAALGGGDWGWYDATTGRLLSSDGQRVLWQRPTTGANAAGSIAGRVGTAMFTMWSGAANQPSAGQPGANYIAVLDANGKPASIFSYANTADVRAVSPLSTGALIGNVGVDAAGQLAAGIPSHFHAALIDLGTAQVHPIPEISTGLAGFNSGKNEHAFVAGAMVGNFMRVQAPGDCLNVRETANTGAKSLGCFRDGVLLKRLDSGESVTAGWYHVSTPGGAPGWASAEFLEP